MYDWPGNVRELRNIVERLSISSGCSICDESILPREMPGPKTSVASIGKRSPGDILSAMERQLLEQALA